MFLYGLRRQVPADLGVYAVRVARAMIDPISLHILYQDESLAVVDKPGGLLAVPGRGPDKQDSVVSRLQRIVPWCIEQPAVHRLDMDTSGLMVLGLTREAHRHLSAQ